jgi:hypothetical protein
VGQTDEFLRQQRASAAAPPDIIVINLGGTDLGHTKGTALVSQMRVDLAVVIQMFPGTTVVYYDILQQRSWMFQWGGGHQQAHRDGPASCQPDGVYISP